MNWGDKGPIKCGAHGHGDGTLLWEDMLLCYSGSGVATVSMTWDSGRLVESVYSFS